MRPMAVWTLAIGLIMMPGLASGWSSFRGGPCNNGTGSLEWTGPPMVIWEHDAGSSVTSSVSAASGIAAFGTGNGSVSCLNATNGTLLWSYQTGARVRSTPCIVPDVGVVYCNDEGTIGLLDASDGSPIWENPPLGDAIVSSPVAVEGRIYVGTYGSELLCLRVANGSVDWTYTGCANWIHTSPAVCGGRVFIGSCDGLLHCLDADTGAVLWRFQAEYIPSSPAVFDGRVYFGSYDSKLHCLDVGTGDVLFESALGGDVYSSPAVDAGGVFVGCDDGRLYALDLLDGTELWNHSSSPGSLQSSPALAEALVAFCDRDGLKVLNRENGTIAHTFRFGDSSDSSPSIYLRMVIWGDGLGYVRAVGPSPESEVGPEDGSWTPLYLLVLSLTAFNVLFLVVILIVLGRMRKRYMRRLEMELGRTPPKGERG